LNVFDATCPLVTKVHLEVVRYSQAGQEAVLIGHEGHPEVEGTMGRYDHASGGAMYLVESVEDVSRLEVRDPQRLAFVTQTTLSVDDTAGIIEALRARFPDIEGPRKDDICYATQNRQDAVRELADASDLLLVVGSRNSSNSNRLRELAEKRGSIAKLIDGPDDVDPAWLEGASHIGITAGASAPEALVQAVVQRLQGLGVEAARERPGREEKIVFTLPKALRGGTKSSAGDG
jgi:4-hydroxy-3-methylbut-2-enyl diphosphate reductase